MAAILTPIYEAEFLGFSYGFRPERGQHDALDALAYGLGKRRINWVLDADIRSFFDTISHAWLIRFIEHRIGDRRIVRLIRKWLAAGVLEEGRKIETVEGTPQGAVISPLLANVYLHYVYDLWVRQWRQRQSTGDMIVVVKAIHPPLFVAYGVHGVGKTTFGIEWPDPVRRFQSRLPDRRPQRGRPEANYQATAGSQRHFSLAKVSLWTQSWRQLGCHLANVG